MWWMPYCTSPAAALLSSLGHAFLMLRGNFGKAEMAFRETRRRRGEGEKVSSTKHVSSETIIPTPFKGRDGHWPVPSPMVLRCLGHCWSRPGEQNMVIPNGEAHLCFVRHKGVSVASVTISVTSVDMSGAQVCCPSCF